MMLTDPSVSRFETCPAIFLVQTSEIPWVLVELHAGLQVSLHGLATGVGPAELLSRVKLGKVKLFFPYKRVVIRDGHSPTRPAK